MIYFGKLLIGVSNWYAGLSNQARLLLASTTGLLLLSLSIYKLLNAWGRLNTPLPKADPQQIIQPMQEILRQVKSPQAPEQMKEFVRLDSLAKALDTQSPN